MLAGRAGYAACTVHLLLPLKRRFSPVTSSISLAESVSVLASFASWRQSVNLAAMWGLFLECSLAYRKLGTGICAILHTLELAFHGTPDFGGNLRVPKWRSRRQSLPENSGQSGG